MNMSDESQLITLDVRGEICPVPLVKATEAMRGASHSDEIEMLTDFMPAVLVVTNAAIKEGWNINIQATGEKEWKVLLTRVS